MRALQSAALAVALLLASIGTASAQDPSALVGTWVATFNEETVTVEFRADGSGTAVEAGDDPLLFNWRAEPQDDQIRLTLDLPDGRMAAMIQFETESRFVMTEPREGEPESVKEGDTIPFVRVAEAAGDETPVAEQPMPAGDNPDIYSRLGLDIATPESTVAAFVAAVQANDGLGVYFLLDPAARQEVWNALRLLDLGPVLGVAGASGADSRSVLEALAPYTVEEDSQPDLPFSIADAYPLLDAVFRRAAETGQYPVVLPADPMVGEPNIAQASEGQMRADVRIDGGGAPVVVHLRRSPAGNWRVLGVTHDPGGPGARTWLLNALR